MNWLLSQNIVIPHCVILLFLEQGDHRKQKFSYGTMGKRELLYLKKKKSGLCVQGSI